MAGEKYSATMADCIAMAERGGGELVRWSGGYWAPAKSEVNVSWPTGRPVPQRYHGTQTVHALIARGVFQAVDEGRGYTTKVRLAQGGRGDG